MTCQSHTVHLCPFLHVALHTSCHSLVHPPQMLVINQFTYRQAPNHVSPVVMSIWLCYGPAAPVQLPRCSQVWKHLLPLVGHCSDPPLNHKCSSNQKTCHSMRENSWWLASTSFPWVHAPSWCWSTHLIAHCWVVLQAIQSVEQWITLCLPACTDAQNLLVSLQVWSEGIHILEDIYYV